MPLETVHFDNVSGLMRTSQNRRVATVFNFTAAGHTEYSVAAPGTPRIEAGMTITAFLEEAGNWQTLIGWRDHESRAIFCDSGTEETVLCAVLPLMIAFLAGTAWRQPLNLVAVGLLAAYLFWSIRRICKLRCARCAQGAATIRTVALAGSTPS